MLLRDSVFDRLCLTVRVGLGFCRGRVAGGPQPAIIGRSIWAELWREEDGRAVLRRAMALIRLPLHNFLGVVAATETIDGLFSRLWSL